MRDISSYFRALADRKRWLIVRSLARHGEMTVTDLGRQLHLSQPLISWHLRMLRKANIVKTRREGRQVWCSLDRESLETYERRIDRILGLAEAPDDDADEQAAELEPAGHVSRIN